jgi:hypothetical protein
MNKHARLTLKITAIAAAVAAACGPAWAAEDDDVKALTKPQSNIEFGIGYTSNDSKRFGQYNGFNQDGGYGLLGGNLIKRDDETGTWMSLSGSNIGLDTQKLRFEHNRQGDWGYYLEYDETPRLLGSACSTDTTQPTSRQTAITFKSQSTPAAHSSTGIETAEPGPQT